MTNVYFISELYLREHTPLNQNIDTKDIMPNIPLAQDMYIQPILGSQFYNSLLISYSAQTLNSNEEYLVSLIKPCLAYYSAYETVPYLNYQLKNKGMQRQFGDNSADVDMASMNFLRNSLKNRAEFYAERIQNYLMFNGNLFPNYVTQATNQDILPDSTAYDPSFATYDGCNLFGSCNNNFNGFFRTFR
jgi:hypothetical protein